LFVRAFDLTGRGQRLSESDPIELPRWAVPENGPGRSFCFAWKRQRNCLELSWRVAAWASGSPRKESSGAAVIDLDTGKVRQQPGAPPEPAPIPAILERLAVRWHASEGGRLRAVVAEEQAGSSAYQRLSALVFRSWDERSSKQGEPVELLRGSDLVVMEDANGRRLWLRDGTPLPDREVKDPPRWLVVEAKDGRTVARVPLVAGTGSAAGHHAPPPHPTPRAPETPPPPAPRRRTRPAGAAP